MISRVSLSLLPSLVVILALACPSPACAQGDFANVQIKPVRVGGCVWMLEGAGGNIGVSAGPDGILIVDDQFAPLAEKIEAALKALNPGPLKFVLNTHWHGDHTGGNPYFGRRAVIVAHTNVRKRLAENPDQPTPPEGLPVVTYDDGVSVHFNGEEIRVRHLPPGHTDGDSVVHFTKSEVIHMGDQFFRDAFPFIDLNSGGDVAGYVRNVAAVLERVTPEVKLIPGHGALASREDLARFHGMLVETTGAVREAIAAGKTLDQIKAAGLPEKWQSWGTRFISTDRWLEICHRGLSAVK